MDKMRDAVIKLQETNWTVAVATSQ